MKSETSIIMYLFKLRLKHFALLAASISLTISLCLFNPVETYAETQMLEIPTKHVSGGGDLRIDTRAGFTDMLVTIDSQRTCETVYYNMTDVITLSFDYCTNVRTLASGETAAGGDGHSYVKVELVPESGTSITILDVSSRTSIGRKTCNYNMSSLSGKYKIRVTLTGSRVQASSSTTNHHAFARISRYVTLDYNEFPTFNTGSNLTHLNPPQNALFLPKPHHNILIYPIGNYSVFKVRFYQ